MTQAAAQLRELIAASPENVEASNALAMTEWRLGNADDAMRRVEEALKRFPTNLGSSVMLARMKLSKRDFAGAEQVLVNATADAPKSSEAALALGELRLIIGEKAKAEVDLAQANEVAARATVQQAEAQLAAATAAYERAFAQK